MAATALLVWIWSPLTFLFINIQPKEEQSMLGWKTHVAGTTSGHFTVNTVHKTIHKLLWVTKEH